MGSNGTVTMATNLRGAVVPWVDVLEVADAAHDEAATGKQIALLFSHAAHPVIVHTTSKEIGPD